MSAKDETYIDLTFAKDLRYETNPRLEAAWLEDWDKREVRLTPADKLGDVYGYAAMWVLGVIVGAMTVLMLVPRCR